jgi:hypothetical protein
VLSKNSLSPTRPEAPDQVTVGRFLAVCAWWHYRSEKDDGKESCDAHSVSSSVSNLIEMRSGWTRACGSTEPRVFEAPKRRCVGESRPRAASATERTESNARAQMTHLKLMIASNNERVWFYGSKFVIYIFGGACPLCIYGSKS